MVSVSGIAAITSLVPGVVVSRSLVAVWIAILLGPCREERVLIPPGFPTWTSCIAVVLPAQQSSFLHFYHLLVIVPNSRGTLVIVVFVGGRVVIIYTSFYHEDLWSTTSGTTPINTKCGAPLIRPPRLSNPRSFLEIASNLYLNYFKETMPEAICCCLHGGSIRTCRPITIFQPKTQQQRRQRACNPLVSLPEPFTFSGPPMDPPFRALSDRVRTGPESGSEHFDLRNGRPGPRHPPLLRTLR